MSNIIKSNFESLTISRQEKLQAAERIKSESDRRVLAAGTTMPIATGEGIDDLLPMLEGIAKSIGINAKDEKSYAIEMTFVRDFVGTNYKHLALNEIKLAFEMMATDALNIPENHKDHYNSFNTIFVSRVLNAYTRHRNKLWAELDHHHKEIKERTEQERLEARSGYLDIIYSAYRLYRDMDQRPRFHAPLIILNEFRKIDFIGKEIKITEHDLKTAAQQLIDNQSNGWDFRKRVMRAMESDTYGSEVETKAISNVATQLIMDCFDKIREQNLNIEDLIR